MYQKCPNQRALSSKQLPHRPVQIELYIGHAHVLSQLLKFCVNMKQMGLEMQPIQCILGIFNKNLSLKNPPFPHKKLKFHPIFMNIIY